MWYVQKSNRDTEQKVEQTVFAKLIFSHGGVMKRIVIILAANSCFAFSISRKISAKPTSFSLFK